MSAGNGFVDEFEVEIHLGRRGFGFEVVQFQEVEMAAGLAELEKRG